MDSPGSARKERQSSAEANPKQRRPSTASGLSSKFSKKHHTVHHFTNDIQHYELISDIGGVDDISYLYLAKHVPTGEYVAIKYTDLTLSPDYELIDELIRTVRNTNLCKHKNILPYWTTFVETERMWNVTCPMKAGSFRNIMQNHFPQGLGEVVVATVLREVLNAIVYLHDNRMIHNDIRADNILMGDHGEIRVTGLRQMISLSQGGEYVESVFSVVGDNIEWAAPEVMAQNSNYDEKADIYSFGITALELAFNRTPFDDWPPLKVLLSKLDYPCPAIPTTKMFSKDFYRMVNACIQKDPSKRPSARELVDHHFIKMSRSTKYLESHVLQRLNGGNRAGAGSPQPNTTSNTTATNSPEPHGMESGDDLRGVAEAVPEGAEGEQVDPGNGEEGEDEAREEGDDLTRAASSDVHHHGLKAKDGITSRSRASLAGNKVAPYGS
ncbi:hypothetical protein HKX48_002402 [Thoreauomyces humboldtii]|nr:hypothetical protein HKX48_002402 [Thoreauomyces humboldtii]